MTIHLNDRKQIAQTGVSVSPLGLGTVKIGRDTAVKYPEGFTIPDDYEVLTLLHTAWDSGINLLDTAPAYGNSEKRLGKLLSQQPHDFVIATKAGEIFDPKTGQSSYNFSPDYITASVKQSLKNLKRTVLDIVLIHSDGNDEAVINKHGALETLNTLKKQGLIRAVGISTKTVAGGLLALNDADLVMVAYHINYQDEQTVLDKATLTNKGIFIKKALASGHLASTQTINLQTNFNFIYHHPAVTSVMIGTINLNHLKSNVLKVKAALYSQ